MGKQPAAARDSARPKRVRGRSRPAMSLTDRAYNDIKFRIITCRYRPGEVLSEAAISGDLNIGRTPVHQAIHRLMNDGLISILPRKGVMVTPVGVEEVMEIIDVRLVNECYCARLAAVHASQIELQELRTILKAAESLINKRDVQEMMLLDRKFHETLANAAKNTVLTEVLRNLHERSLRFWFISLRDPDYHRIVWEQHSSIVGALELHDPNAAELAMREHILSFQRNVTRKV
jgi:DNA-binding GntR family transcriptional regulator